MVQNSDYKLLENQWKLYKQYAEEIENLKELENHLKDYTIKCFFSAMDNFGFFPATNYTNTKGKHFFANKEFFETAGLTCPKYFRFYFWFDELVSYSSISIYFELFGEYTRFGPVIRDRLRSSYTPPHSFSIGINGGVNSDYYHLIVNDRYSFAEDRPLHEQIVLLFQEVFFNDEFNAVQMCTKWVEEEINSQ